MRFIFSCCLFFLIYPAIAGNPDCPQQHCAIVIDAGSSGSRLHLYAYDLDKTNSPIHISEQYVKKIKPGLATLEPNEATIDAYLTILFANTPGSSFPVYFYATGGMRLLTQPKQAQFYNLVEQWFQKNGNFKLVAAKTITGNDEGLYGWLALNYQLNNFAKDNPKPIGYMDMGGASVEIVFPITDAEPFNSKDIKVIDLYGHRFKVFMHSFLGLGVTEVTHQFLETSSCFSKGYEMPNKELADGDEKGCENEVASLINNIHHVNTIIQPYLVTNPIAHWYATGALTDLVRSQPFHFSDNQFTSQQLFQQAEAAVCSQPWSILNTQYPNNEYLYSYCLSPAYYYALMVDGYGIPLDKSIHYLPKNQDADWTLGVVIDGKKLISLN